MQGNLIIYWALHKQEGLGRTHKQRKQFLEFIFFGKFYIFCNSTAIFYIGCIFFPHSFKVM